MEENREHSEPIPNFSDQELITKEKKYLTHSHRELMNGSSTTKSMDPRMDHLPPRINSSFPPPLCPPQKIRNMPEDVKWNSPGEGTEAVRFTEGRGTTWVSEKAVRDQVILHQAAGSLHSQSCQDLTLFITPFWSTFQTYTGLDFLTGCILFPPLSSGFIFLSFMALLYPLVKH